MIIKSRCIFDSIHDEPFDGYVQIKGKHVTAVGKGQVLEELAAEDSVQDYGNRTVMPGFCDNHVHVFLGGIDISTCNIACIETEEAAARKLYEFYKDRDDEWIVGFGWSHFDWPDMKLPTKETLDRFFPDRPVVAVNDELHAVWVNSEAMRKCGVTKDTEDPPYCMIQRDENGEPTGYILEQEAMRLVTDVAFDMEPDKEKEIIRAFIKRANEQGVTSVGDMEIIGVQKADAFNRLAREGELDLRIFFSPSIRTPLEELLQLKENFTSDRLAFLGAKGFVDGTPLGHTGLMVDDYADIPGCKGSSALDLDWLEETIVKLNTNGIPVRLHACGDGAVREGLRDIKKAKAKGAPEGLRNTIEHVECIHPDELDLFAETGTVASIQPYHMVMETFEEHPAFEILGYERVKLSWASKTLKNHGAHVALGTDCPIVPLDPLQTMYCAMNRVMEDEMPEGGWNPQEKLTLSEAIKGCTAEPAYIYGREDRLGIIKEGALADMIVMSENIFEMDPLNIREACVVRTILDGETVYEKEE